MEGKNSVLRRKRGLFYFILVLSFFASLSASVIFVAAQGNVTVYPWPTIRHDLSGTGYSTSPAPHVAKLLWNYTTGGAIYSTAAVANGMVFIGSTDGRLYALNISTGKQIWNQTAGTQYSSPAVADGVVFIGSHTDYKVHAFDGKTGKSLWNSSSTGALIWSSPVVADGRVFIGSNGNQGMLCLNEANGALVWNYSVGASIYSSPVVVDGRVFMGSTNGKVYALNATTGAFLWSYTTGSSIWSSPAVVGGIVYIGSYDGKFYALRASTGQHVWNYTTGLVFSTPAVASGIVYTGTNNGPLYALNASTGRQIWNYTNPGIWSSPIVADGMVFMGSLDDRFYALNMFTGKQIWNYTTGGAIRYSGPAVADGLVFIGSNDGKLYAFGNTYGTIKGVVTYQGTGTPIAGANVTAKGYKTVTASNGSYSLRVWVGPYNLTVSKQGYYSNVTLVTVGPDDVITKNLTTRYIPAIVTGTLTDSETAALVSGATVAAGSVQNTTGSNGRYSLSLLPGTYTITFSKTGYFGSSSPLTVGANETKTVNIAMVRIAILTGTITDKKTGNPISGATVIAGSTQTSTGSDGKYTLNVPPGNYNLTVSMTGYVTNGTMVTASGGVTHTLNVALKTWGIISGVVTDKDSGAFIVGATVKVDSVQTLTGSDGKYTLIVEAGTYTITVSKQGYDIKTASVTVGAGASQTANFTVSPPSFPLLLVIAGVGGAAAIAAVVLLMKRKPKPPPKPVEKVPKAAMLRMAADPTELLANGKSTSAITIELLDEEGKPIKAAEDTEVKLSATLGKITSPVTIKAGESTGKATLTSSTEFGEGKVSAESKGLKGASISLTFVERKRYCMHCGTRMALDSNVCPKCGKSPPSGVDVKVCPGCGEVIPIVANFCSNCGARQPETEKS